MPRLFGKKIKSKKSPARRAMKLLLLPLAALLAVMFVFFAIDDFWLMAKLMILDGSTISNTGDGITYNYPGNIGTGGANSADGAHGTNGLNMMLMNSMTGGYCADWLTLARDHCNRKYMMDEVAFPNDVNPSIVLMTGTAMKETGLETITLSTGATARVPKCSFDLTKAKYGEVVDGCQYTLYQVSSEFLKNHLDYVHKSFETSLKSSSSGYYGTFQMSRGMLSKVPTEPDAGGAGNFPSTLSGYGMSETRSNSNGDFGFFPDQMSSNLQSCWSRWARNYRNLGGKDIDFTRDSAVGLGYAATNAGEGNVANWFGLGTWSGNVGRYDGVTNRCAAAQAYPSGEAKGSCVADAMNQLMDACDIIMTYISNHPDEMSEALYVDRKTFQGITAGAVMFGCKNGFVTSANKTRLIEQMDNAHFKTGATIAYRALKNKPTATEEEVAAIFAGLSTTVGEERKALTGAYNLLDSKATQYGDKYAHLCLHFEDESHTFTYDGKTYPVIHAADIEPASGIYWIPMGGAYLYWKMLTYAGVECTFQEALGDAKSSTGSNGGEGGGGLISSIPATPTATGSGGQAIAVRMAQICYPTMTEGKNEYRVKFKALHGKEVYSGASPLGVVCGNKVYLQAHHAVMSEDQGYWASCDRGVCTAVRWAGADDNFKRGDCYAQLDYFVSQSKSSTGRWVEVNWGGNTALLQPGDIFIRSDKWEIAHGKDIYKDSGHIVCYIGDTIARQVWPNSTTTTTVGHSSYNDRPPCMGNFYGHLNNRYGRDIGLATFRVFRNVRPMETSKYAGFTPST